MLQRFPHITIICQSESEIQSRRQHGVFGLAENITNGGQEARQGHLVLVCVRHLDVPHHHGHPGHTLRQAIPAVLVQRGLGRDGDFQPGSGIHLVGDAYLVVVQLAELQLITLSVLRACRDADALGALAMGNLQRGVGPQHDFLLEAALVAGQVLLGLLFLALGLPFLHRGIGVFALGGGLFSYLVFLFSLFSPFFLPLLALGFFLPLLSRYLSRALLPVEPVIGGFQEGDMIIEFLHVERGVHVQIAIVGYGVAQSGAILQLRAACPVIGGYVVGISGDPIEDGYQVERRAIREGECLIIIQWRAKMADTGPHGVLPRLVTVRIQVFVHGCIGFLYLGVGSALEIHVQIASQVPTNRELPVPQELLAERQGKLGVLQRFHIPFLEFIVITGHLCIESHILRQPVQAELLQYLPPFTLALDVLERSPRLVDGSPVVIQRGSPVGFPLIDGGLASGFLVRMAIRDGEVGGVVGHGMTLGGDAHPCVGDREVGLLHLGHGNAFDRIPLMLVGRRIQRIVQQHIGVHRIVLRRGLLLGDTII